MLAALVTGAQESGVERLVEQLSSDSFVDRELAADELEYNQSYTLDQLEEQLSREDLSPEQRLRLNRAAMVRFISEPRAAMGIQLSNESSELGLKITGTVDGFDSVGKLQANDIISEINRWPIRSGADLQVAIVSRSPGESVPVVLLRGDRQIEIDVTLGDWDQLGTQGGLSRAALRAAWLHRSRGYADIGSPEVLDFNADTNSWDASASKPWNGPTPRRDSSGMPLRRMIVVGGEARDRPGALAGVRLDRPLSRSARGRASDFPPMLRNELVKTEVEIVAMEERIRRAQLQLDVFRRNGARRQQIEQTERQLEAYQISVSELQRKADRLRSELKELGIQDP